MNERKSSILRLILSSRPKGVKSSFHFRQTLMKRNLRNVKALGNAKTRKLSSELDELAMKYEIFKSYIDRLD